MLLLGIFLNYSCSERIVHNPQPEPTKTLCQAANILNANTHRYYIYRLVNILNSNIYQENMLPVVRTIGEWFPQNHLTWGWQVSSISIDPRASNWIFCGEIFFYDNKFSRLDSHTKRELPNLGIIQLRGIFRQWSTKKSETLGKQFERNKNVTFAIGSHLG